MGPRERIIYLNKPKEEVFKTIFNKEYANNWLGAFAEDVQLKGELKENGSLEFDDPKNGTACVEIKDYKLNKNIKLEYVSFIKPDGTKETLKPGAFEQYMFDSSEDGGTCLTVRFTTGEDKADEHINVLWDKAADRLRALYK